ncbi:unnamed protein product [Candida parapsilosis]|nr:unnamed protein product [Candida parapsilosis]
MKIKCNEGKPSCENCVQTQRICVYVAPPKPTLPRARKRASRPVNLKTTSVNRVSSIKKLDAPGDTKSPSFITVSSNKEKLLERILCRSPRNPTPPNYADYLARSLVLNSSSTMLGLSRFELRLLKFFDTQGVYMLSFGVNEGVHNAWKYKVPQLFMESELVRQSVFAFATVALSDNIPIPEVQSLDMEDASDKLAIQQKTRESDSATVDNMYLQTMSHFLDTLAKAQERNRQVGLSNSFEDPFTAMELKVSSTLIFALLGIQPYGFIKLINFNRDNEETDLVTFAKSTRDITLNWASTLLQSKIGGLLYLRINENTQSPRSKECNYPIIKYLLQQLYQFQDSTNEDKVANEISQLYQTLQLTLDCLTKALFSCQYYRFPLPLFRFLSVVPDEFRTLLYAKHPFALKVLYIYASLCFVARFQMFKQYNIWRDFVVWYEHEIGLTDTVERSLFKLVVDQCFVVTSYEKFPLFDPIELM